MAAGAIMARPLVSAYRLARQTMPRLTAQFQMPLKRPILTKDDGKSRTYRCKLDGFDIELILTPTPFEQSKHKTERLWTRFVETLVISVSRDEEESVPPIVTSSRGARDFALRSPYFTARTPAYASAAETVAGNVVAFFRLRLHQPLVGALDDSHQALANPTWRDSAGHELDRGGGTFVVEVVHGIRNELGVTKFQRRHDASLRAALASSVSPGLHAELLSDAQAAAFDGNIRRAVLELAIACEVFAKHRFLGLGSSTAQVIETLEDRGKISLRVLDLIEIGGTTLKHQSFKAHDKAAFQDIDHLFRARNKVAHRGEPVFRDDLGTSHTVDARLLRRWWISIEKLFKWAG